MSPIGPTMTREHRPFERLAEGEGVDVVVTDLGLPDISGLEVTRRIKGLRPETRVLMLTAYSDDEHIRGMMETGADGYLLKLSAAQELPEALRTIMRGETVLHPLVAAG